VTYFNELSRRLLQGLRKTQKTSLRLVGVPICNRSLLEHKSDALKLGPLCLD